MLISLKTGAHTQLKVVDSVYLIYNSECGDVNDIIISILFLQFLNYKNHTLCLYIYVYMY